MTIAKKIAFVVLMSSVFATFAMAQSDVFGAMAPKSNTTQKSKEIKKNLPDMPNKIDEKGRKQGKWAKKYANGQYKYVATFVDDKPVGKVVRYTEEGKKISESSFNADGSANVTYFHDNGNKASEGRYTINKKRDGLWVYYNERKVKVAAENYSNGKLNGTSYTYYENGQVAEEINYVNDELHGPWFQYLQSGKRRLDTHYVNGKLDGLYKYWDENGFLSVEGRYRNGIQIGDWKIYEENGSSKYFTLQYDNNGTLLNEDEFQKRMNDKLDELEAKRKFIVDPADYMNTPELYKP